MCFRGIALNGAGSVLLSGPSGVGKMTAVRVACSCLNLHLFKVILLVASHFAVWLLRSLPLYREFQESSCLWEVNSE